MKVVIYQIMNHHRSQVVCAAFEAGIRRVGDTVTRIPSVNYRGTPEFNVCVFYGLQGPLKAAFNDYSRDPHRRVVFVDLGYIGRKSHGRFQGFHKVTVDSRHPTKYFQRVKHDQSRLDTLGLDVAPWREPSPDGHIVVAGMAPKGAHAEGFAPMGWERRAIATMRKHTKRRIVYRPKPNWLGAVPIPGAEYSRPGARTLLQDLEGAHAIVSHHSNANIEALVAGVPGFTEGGLASAISSSDLTQIESPRMDGDRVQWLADLAWCQWSISEIAEGLPWRHLKDEGLI